MFPTNGPIVDADEIQQEVSRFRQRPLVAVAFILAIVAFGVWFMSGGGASGSSRQAEQLILSTTATAPGAPISGSQVATVHCSESGQSFIGRVVSLFEGGSPSDQQRNSPWTFYSCGGTTVGGTSMYWCVAFPPRSNPYDQSPKITIQPQGAPCTA